MPRILLFPINYSLQTNHIDHDYHINYRVRLINLAVPTDTKHSDNLLLHKDLNKSHSTYSSARKEYHHQPPHSPLCSPVYEFPSSARYSTFSGFSFVRSPPGLPHIWMSQSAVSVDERTRGPGSVTRTYTCLPVLFGLASG